MAPPNGARVKRAGSVGGNAVLRVAFNPRTHMSFPHPRTYMGEGDGCNPHAISPLIKIELWDKDKMNSWDVLTPMVPELTSLGHTLTPPGRVKVKKIAE